MEYFRCKSFLACLVLIAVTFGSSVSAQDHGHQHFFEDQYHLDWVVNRTRRIVTFTAKANTTGWVGLGINDDVRDGMREAELMIAGIGNNQSSYSLGYVGNRFANVPPTEIYTGRAWRFMRAEQKMETGENSTVNYPWTTVVWERDFDRDSEIHYDDIDLVDDDPILILVSFGESDNITQHARMGSLTTRLLRSSAPNSATPFGVITMIFLLVTVTFMGQK